MSTSPAPRPTAVGRYLAKAFDYASHYAFEIIVLAMIVYLCVARGLSVSVDIYNPLEPTASPALTSSLEPAPEPRATSTARATVATSVGGSAVAQPTAYSPTPARTVLDPATSTRSTASAATGNAPAAPARPAVAAPQQASVSSWNFNLGGLTQYLSGCLASLFSGEETTVAEGTATGERTVAIDAKHAGFNEVAVTDDPAPHISNLTLVLSPDYGERKGLAPRIIKAKKARVQNYIDTYLPIAKAEMEEFGIPVSITLAQGLLESNAGDSKLSRVSNNHFGIKCRKKCLGCTCRNYGDDTRYDMFRVFDSPAESFREHSELLNTSRYKKLKSYGMDYYKWAHGLKACGYATDKKYGEKLVTIIENLGLWEYDQ